MRFRLAPAIIIAIVVAASGTVASARASEPSFRAPPKGTRLKRNMDFWVRVYTEFFTYQGLVHDAADVERVYEVLDFRHKSEREKDRLIAQSRRHWREVLQSLHKKQFTPQHLTADEKHVFQMFAADPSPLKFARAASTKRLRFQLGQKDRFMEGIHDSGRYLPHMEEIFKREGLPVELTRLPFVESSFNLHAKSKVGASGVWQFMPGTGKHYLQINSAVDERNDPIRATEAAARLLRSNHKSLGSWPLAVTAYNHGARGVATAMRRSGSDDLEELVDTYSSKHFGFASSNFYTELLAALEAERNASKYFGHVTRAGISNFYEVKLPHYILMPELCRFLSLEVEPLRELNPALNERVFKGKLRIPAGYRLRLPLAQGGAQDRSERLFLAGYSQIPAMFKHRGQGSGRGGRMLASTTVTPRKHRVKGKPRR